MTDDLIDRLARLGDGEFQDTVRAARTKRRHLVQAAIHRVRKAMLSGLSARKAASTIDDAVRGRRVRSDSALRKQIYRQLEADLGHLEDVPGVARIRQLIENQE